jgi:hypothetical protein
VLGFLDQAASMQHLRRDLFIRVEMLIESGETDLEPLLLEDIRETTLGKRRCSGIWPPSNPILRE